MGLAESGRRGVHVGRPTHGYRLHGRRMLADTHARHDQQFALLRERHPQLFAARRANWRRSTAPWRVRLLVPVAERAPQPRAPPAGAVHRVAGTWAEGLAEADDAVSRAGPSASSAHIR